MRALVSLVGISLYFIISGWAQVVRAGNEFPQVFQMQIVVFQDGTKQISLNPEALAGDIRAYDGLVRAEETVFNGKPAQVVTLHVLASNRERIVELKRRAGIETDAFPLIEGAFERKERRREFPTLYAVQISFCGKQPFHLSLDPTPLEKNELDEKKLVSLLDERQPDDGAIGPCPVLTCHVIGWSQQDLRQLAKLAEK
ncbi:MAG: hypothetical protein K1Y36_25965 [Blastocatellia bacterium]|nr:hypothetical protein [Blastocatellia bacterium]